MVDIAYKAKVVSLPVYSCYKPNGSFENLEIGDIIDIVYDVADVDWVAYLCEYGWSLSNKIGHTDNYGEYTVNSIQRECIESLNISHPYPTTCTCDIFLLMAKGCQCGAIAQERT
jgi:hypothetical protein